MIGRRAFVLGAAAISASPARATKAPTPPKAAFVHWPGVGRELHGFMAIPANARGRQPALLVCGRRPDYAQAMTIWLATIGFVACSPKSADVTDLQATVRWLATNAYATGRVGAVLLGESDALPFLSPSLVCAVAVGAQVDAPGLPLLRVDRLDPDAPAEYVRAEAFLKEHLR